MHSGERVEASVRTKVVGLLGSTMPLLPTPRSGKDEQAGETGQRRLG